MVETEVVEASAQEVAEVHHEDEAAIVEEGAGEVASLVSRVVRGLSLYVDHITPQNMHRCSMRR